MSRTLSSIVRNIAISTLAAGLAVTVLGGAASADEPTVQQRAEAEMNQGKDYAAAWADATRAAEPAYSPELVAQASRGEDALAQGKDYVTAWGDASASIPTDFSPQQIARAEKVDEEMGEGKDYVAAWEAADEAQPTTVEVSRLSTGSAVTATQ